MPAGRPPKYGDEMLDRANEYIDACVDMDRDPDETMEPQAHGGSLMRRKNLKVRLPSKGGLAAYLGVARDTLYDWASKYEDFSYVMERLGAIQEQRLIDNGLSGDYNPTIAKVLLTKHGYREGIDQTSDDKQIQGVIYLPKKNEDALEAAGEAGDSSRKD